MEQNSLSNSISIIHKMENNRMRKVSNPGIFHLSLVATIGLSISGLIGYFPGLGILGSIQPDYIPMAPSTAISFIILSLCLYYQTKHIPKQFSIMVLMSSSILVSLFGLLEFIDYFTGTDLNFENVIFPEFGQLDNIPIARMSPSTGVLFFLFGLCLTLIIFTENSNKEIGKVENILTGILLTLGIFGASTFLLGYFYGNPLLYNQKTIPMALSTSMCFCFLGLGLLKNLGSTRFPLSLLFITPTQSMLARIFIPLICIALIIQGLLLKSFDTVFKFNDAIYSSVILIIFILIVGVVTSRLSKKIGETIDNAETQRKVAEEQIKASLKEKETLLHDLEKEITERKQVENEKTESEEKFRSLSENSQDYIMRYDKQHRHLYQNQAAYRVSGFTEEEFVGKTHRELGFDEKLCELWGKRINEVFQSGESSREIFSWDSKEGPVYLDLKLFPELDNESNVKTVLGVSRDITELKKHEEKIKASLEEKEILIDEIHHRVKNNMNVVSSILKLQANSIEDERTKDILKESQSRIYAMSAIHETLHGSENLSEIDLKNYLTRITTSVFQASFTDSKKVKLKNDIEEIPISINQASPLGLVINELLSNSLKYAFPDDREGEIKVGMKKQDQELQLTVKDNGVGISKDLDWKKASSLGLKLVRTLVENQLDGSIDMESNNGTKFTINFKIET
jgi:PAS domain S-box-containing protein